jgi:hypothetical protein
LLWVITEITQAILGIGASSQESILWEQER